MKNERWLSRNLRENCTDERVALRSFEWIGQQAVPDLLCIARRNDQERANTFWIELKVVNTRGQKLPYRPGQLPWIKEWHAAGGRSIVLVWCDKEKTLYFLQDKTAVRIGARCLQDYEDAGGVLDSVGPLQALVFWSLVRTALARLFA